MFGLPHSATLVPVRCTNMASDRAGFGRSHFALWAFGQMRPAQATVENHAWPEAAAVGPEGLPER